MVERRRTEAIRGEKQLSKRAVKAQSNSLKCCLIRQLRGSVKEDGISTPDLKPALHPRPGGAGLGRAAEATPSTGPQCSGTAVTQHTVGFPWGQIQLWVRDSEVSIRDETSASPPASLSPSQGDSLCFRLRIHPAQWGSGKGHHEEHAVAFV